MSDRPKLVVFGASNAEAFFGMSGGTNFSAHGVLREVHNPSSTLVRETSNQIRINLTGLKRLEGADRHEGTIINGAEAGKNMSVLARTVFPKNV